LESAAFFLKKKKDGIILNSGVYRTSRSEVSALLFQEIYVICDIIVALCKLEHCSVLPVCIHSIIGKVTKRALKGYIEGRRPGGRPRGRWLDVVDRAVKRTFTDHCHRVETKLQSINIM
jgi:hypothetical protein